MMNKQLYETYFLDGSSNVTIITMSPGLSVKSSVSKLVDSETQI